MKTLVHTVYYLLERAQLLNNTEDFSFYKKILVSYHKKGLLKKYLTPYQKSNLQYMVKEGSAGILPFEPNSPVKTEPSPLNTILTNEQQLSNYISNNIQLLGLTLGEPNLQLALREVQTVYSEEYGYIDIVAKADDIRYVCELKLGKADHSIIGQIEKYRLFYYLLRPLGHFSRVIGVTIASDYDDFVKDQLQQKGIIVLRYSTSEVFRMERI